MDKSKADRRQFGMMAREVDQARHEIKMIAIGEGIERSKRNALQEKALKRYKKEHEFELTMKAVDHMMSNSWNWDEVNPNNAVEANLHGSYCCWKFASALRLQFTESYGDWVHNPKDFAMMDALYQYLQDVVCDVGRMAKFDWQTTDHTLREATAKAVLASDTPAWMKDGARNWLGDEKNYQQHSGYFYLLNVVQWFDLSENEMIKWKLEPHKQTFDCPAESPKLILFGVYEDSLNRFGGSSTFRANDRQHGGWKEEDFKDLVEKLRKLP